MFVRADLSKDPVGLPPSWVEAIEADGGLW